MPRITTKTPKTSTPKTPKREIVGYREVIKTDKNGKFVIGKDGKFAMKKVPVYADEVAKTPTKKTTNTPATCRAPGKTTTIATCRSSGPTKPETKPISTSATCRTAAPGKTTIATCRSNPEPSKPTKPTKPIPGCRAPSDYNEKPYFNPFDPFGIFKPK